MFARSIGYARRVEWADLDDEGTPILASDDEETEREDRLLEGFGLDGADA
jgi:hypothetical protein